MHFYSLLLEEELFQNLKDFAHRERQPVSRVIREAVRRMLESPEITATQKAGSQ